MYKRGFIIVFILLLIILLALIISRSSCSKYGDVFSTLKEDSVELTKDIRYASDNLCFFDRMKFNREIVNILEIRKNLLIEDIKNNPVKALAVEELPQEIISKLSVQDRERLIEKRGELSGELEIVYEEILNEPERTFFYLRTDDGKRYQLFAENELSFVPPGTKVGVKGIAIDEVMAIEIPEGMYFTDVKYSPGEEPNENLGEQKTLVIVTGNTELSPPVSVEEVQNIMFGEEYNTVRDFYDKNSFSKTSIVGDVVGPYTLKNTFANGDMLIKEALQTVKPDVERLGKSLSDYKTAVIITPCWIGCGGGSTFNEFKTVFSNGEEIVMDAVITRHYIKNQFDLFTLAHELGHTLGLNHANSYNCYDNAGETKSFSLSCNDLEYGDSQSIMGSSKIIHHNAPHKKQLGWLSDDNIIVTKSGTYEISPVETLESKNPIKMLAVPVEIETSHFAYSAIKNNLFYTIELRQSIDYDSNLEELAKDSFKSISIRLADLNEPERFSTSAIKYKNDIGEWNQYLGIGKSFEDEINGYRITLISITGEGKGAVAKVKIESMPKKINFDFNLPLIDYRFQEKIIPNSILKDSAGYIAGGVVKGKDSYPSSEEEGIRFYENGQYSYSKVSENVEINSFYKFFIMKKNEFSVSTLIKLKEYPIDSGIIFTTRSIIIKVDKSGFITFSAYFDSESERKSIGVTSTKPINMNEWSHIAGIYDGSSLILYINGQEVGRKDNLGKLNLGYFVKDYLGGQLGRGGVGINGILDDFRIYARGISLTEARNLAGEIFIKPKRGDTNSDGIFDISDAVAILLYLFQDGKLSCAGAADVDGSGAVDINDAVYLLNWLYQAGPAPIGGDVAC